MTLISGRIRTSSDWCWSNLLATGIISGIGLWIIFVVYFTFFPSLILFGEKIGLFRHRGRVERPIPMPPRDGEVFSDWRAINLHIVTHAVDNVGISHVDFLAQRASGGEWILLGSDYESSIQRSPDYKYEWSGLVTPGPGLPAGTAPLDFGRWKIRAVAYDVAGNSANSYRDFTVEFRSVPPPGK